MTNPTPEITLTYRGRVDPNEIVFLNQLIESHEGVGLLRTIDFREGLIEYWIPESRRSVFEEILREIQGRNILTTCEQGVWTPEIGDES